MVLFSAEHLPKKQPPLLHSVNCAVLNRFGGIADFHLQPNQQWYCATLRTRSLAVQIALTSGIVP